MIIFKKKRKIPKKGISIKSCDVSDNYDQLKIVYNKIWLVCGASISNRIQKTRENARKCWVRTDKHQPIHIKYFVFLTLKARGVEIGQRNASKAWDLIRFKERKNFNIIKATTINYNYEQRYLSILLTNPWGWISVVQCSFPLVPKLLSHFVVSFCY